MNETKNYRIRAGTLGYKYAILITFEHKKNLEPLIKLIKAGFIYFENERKRIEKAIELEKKEKKKKFNSGRFP